MDTCLGRDKLASKQEPTQAYLLALKCESPGGCGISDEPPLSFPKQAACHHLLIPHSPRLLYHPLLHPHLRPPLPHRLQEHLFCLHRKSIDYEPVYLLIYMKALMSGIFQN